MGSSHSSIVVLDSRLDELDRLHDAIAAFCAAAGRTDDASVFALCAEELVTNTILHGMGAEAGHPITIELTLLPPHMTCCITDDGPPFDPTVDIDADVESDIDNRPTGGLGRHLVSTLMDEFRYLRRDRQNVVSFGRAVRPSGGEAVDAHD